MKSPLYLAIPLGGALLLGLGYSLAGETVVRSLLTTENIIAFGAATLGSLLAARAFGKGDYLRTAWALMGLCYALLLIDTSMFGASNSAVQREVSTFEALTSGALTLTANLVTIISLVLVARAWRVAGLDLQVSRGAFIGSMAFALVVSCAIVGRGVLADVTALAGGKLDAIQALASSLGDVATTVLLIPLLLTALSLRGGSLAWPWALLTASTALWLGVDAMALVTDALGVAPATLMPIEESCRFGACLFQLTAGLAQRDAVRAI